MLLRIIYYKKKANVTSDYIMVEGVKVSRIQYNSSTVLSSRDVANIGI